MHAVRAVAPNGLGEYRVVWTAKSTSLRKRNASPALSNPAKKRSSVAEAGSFAVRWTGVPFVARRIAARHRAGVIVYHDPTPETVRQHLELLSKWHVFVPTTRSWTRSAGDGGRTFHPRLSR